MPQTERTHVIAALTAAWTEAVKDYDYGLPMDRPDDSGQRDNLVRCAMDLIQAIKQMDEQSDVKDLTMGDAPGEGTRNTSQTAAYRILVEHLDTAADAVLGQQVRRLRLLGVPWNKIGMACGMTAQGIYKKASQHNWVAVTDNGSDSE